MATACTTGFQAVLHTCIIMLVVIRVGDISNAKKSNGNRIHAEK
jgi:hypothetical protein